ncbi:MAG: aminopeptidase P family protein [Anaerolineales bacterium]|nr:aminopeptidase P family protein [Anaerolineales bacterium]
MVNEELARARAALAAAGCDVALLSSVAHVTYVSGFAMPHAVGFSAVTPYAAPFAVLPVAGDCAWLATSVFHAAQAQRESRLEHLLTYAGFDSFSPTDPRASYLNTLRDALRQAGLVGRGRLGVEARALPYGAAAALAAAFPHVTLVPVDEALATARLTKTAREIARLRRAAQIGDVGQQALAALVQTAGRNEFELYGVAVAQMQAAAGAAITVIGELVTGPRLPNAEYPAGPRDRTTVTGDVALLDTSQRVDGYWSDCTNTHLVGGATPTAWQHKYVRAAREAFEAVVEQLRPGRRAAEAWAAAEVVFERYGLTQRHYLGHQLGVTDNEDPRLTAYDQTPLEADMVFAIEPGAYEDPGGSFGVRFEKVVHVKVTGPEILSQFEWGL